MTTADPVVLAALGPVREALLTRARRQAAQRRAEADEAAAGVLRAAAAEAGNIVAEARRQGEADAAAALAGEAARVRREARSIVQRAQRAAYEDLRARARAAASGLFDGVPPERLAARLAEVASARLGGPVTVLLGPAGSLVAERAGRRIEWSPATLADHAVAALGVETEKLWAP